jgi:PDZ domain-containing protein
VTEPAQPAGPAEKAGLNGPTGPADRQAPPSPPPPEPDPHHLSRRSTFVLVGAFLAVVAAAVLSLVHLPYAILSPGPAYNTLGSLEGHRLITVSGAPTYPTKGALDFTTVGVSGGPQYPVNTWDVLEAALDPNRDVYDAKLFFPEGVTTTQVEEESAAEMSGSQQEAIAVALKALGKPVTEHVVISGVSDDAPSKALLRAGDQIRTVDGKPVTGPATVRDGVQAHQPGEGVELGLRRGGRDLTVTALTRDVQGRATVGILLGVTFDFPFSVKINVGPDIGGPSAGTMFALGIYDTLTPGDLTGGARIAGTGTVDTSGAVGPIGGIRQKLVGAREAGARWFLAPASNCDEVVGHVPSGLRVVRVASFEEALTSVQDIAAQQGDGLPTCTR